MKYFPYGGNNRLGLGVREKGESKWFQFLAYVIREEWF